MAYTLEELKTKEKNFEESIEAFFISPEGGMLLLQLLFMIYLAELFTGLEWMVAVLITLI